MEKANEEAKRIQENEARAKAAALEIERQEAIRRQESVEEEQKSEEKSDVVEANNKNRFVENNCQLQQHHLLIFIVGWSK